MGQTKRVDPTLLSVYFLFRMVNDFFLMGAAVLINLVNLLRCLISLNLCYLTVKVTVEVSTVSISGSKIL
jgi:hypothetical protein